MSDQNKNLHIAILEYLQRLSRQPGSLDGDSIDVATQCLSEAFGLDLYDSNVQGNFLSKQGKSLEEVFAAGLTGGSSASKSDQDEAKTETKKAPTEAEIKQSELFKGKGNACLSSQDYNGAIQNYDEAIALNPVNHILYANKATCLFKMEKWAESAKCAQKSIALNNHYSKSHYRLGLAYSQLKKYGDAIEALNNAKKIAQGNGETALVTEIDAALKTAKSTKNSTAASTSAASNSAANPMGGLDFSAIASMLGGGAGAGAGGMGLESILQNPMFAQMAQGLMANMMGGNASAGAGAGATGHDDEDYDGEEEDGEENEEGEEGDEEEESASSANSPWGGIDTNDPTIQRIMQEVQMNPMAAMQYLNNPEIMAKIGPMMQQMMGGMMGVNRR